MMSLSLTTISTPLAVVGVAIPQHSSAPAHSTASSAAKRELTTEMAVLDERTPSLDGGPHTLPTPSVGLLD